MSKLDAEFETNFREFSLAMGRKMDYLGLCGQKVVKDEAGKLAYTLIKLSGPKANKEQSEAGLGGIAAAKQRIAAQVSSVFGWLGTENPKAHAAEAKSLGAGQVKWYAWDRLGLFGVAADKDLTGASVDDLYLFYLGKSINTSGNRWKNSQMKGRMAVGRRGKQTVYLWMQAVSKKETVEKLIKKIQSHIGRRQAGWLPAWVAGGSPVLANPIAKQVTDHAMGARGSFVDGTKNATLPEFTLINQATGSKKLKRVLSKAMQIRHESMVKDLALYVRGVKKLSTVAHLK